MAKDNVFRIVFTGGGSGGHVYPTLAIARELQKGLVDLGMNVKMTRMGPQDGYDALFKNMDIAISPIVGGKIRRYASFQNFIDTPKFLIGFLQALIKLYFVMPDVIFSKGGTGALPVVVAGWCYHIPVVIHESDAQPGLTNRTSARFAKKIFISFPRAAEFFDPKKVELTGSPVRADLLAGRTTKELAKETLGFGKSEFLTLILGGSQGSKRINEFILENLAPLIKITQVFHQTGVANLAEVQALARAITLDESFQNRYQATGYLVDNMNLAFTAADLVVARAGSNTIFEIAAFGLPAILIPLAESANDHQRANANEFAKTGGAVVIEEANLLAGIFLNQVKTIADDAAQRAKMSEASGKFFTPDAAQKIAQGLYKLARE